MRILIIGSSGFIGSHLGPFLAGEGHEVVGLDLNDPTGDFGLSRFTRGDIRDRVTLAPALEGVDCVVNLAAVHADSGHEDSEYFATNSHGTGELLAAMADAGVKRHIFTSTVAVYGERPDISDETTPSAPILPYGKSKLEAEERIRDWVRQDPTRSAVILRPCLIFGERNVANMFNLIRQIDSGYFSIFGSGENIKSIGYVGNLVGATGFCLGRMKPGVVTYNYCDEPNQPVYRTVEIIRSALGKKGGPLRLPLWFGLAAAVPFEIVSAITGRTLPVMRARVRKLATPTMFAAEKIREAGFRQQVPLEEGLRRMVNDYLDEKRAD